MSRDGGFATMQAIAGKKPYFTLSRRDYVRIAESLGSRGAFLIEAVLPPTDISPTWTRIADEVRSRLRPAPTGAKNVR